MTDNDAQSHLKIFVTVGTHEQGFPRLLSAVKEIVGTGKAGTAWRIQTGPATVDYPDSVETRESYTHDEMLSNLGWADAMISQASPGNVFTALEMTTQPIVIARRHELSEHVDNHQTIFARYLSESGLAMVAENSKSLSGHLNQLRTEPPAARYERLAQLQRVSLAKTQTWVKRVDEAIRELFID